MEIDRRDFLARQIGQLESGNSRTIGYHGPKSSAYGQYGFTAPTWSEMARRNPALPADITQATPDHQRAAFDMLADANGRQLTGYGVPVHDGTLALAHGLGAKGAADYLRDGTLSEAAMAANGGRDALDAIARRRLAMGQDGAQPARDAAVASAPEVTSGTAMTPRINTDGDPGGPAGHGSGPAPAEKGAEKGADYAGALEIFGKSLSKMGRDIIGPDAASIVKPRTFADPAAGEMLPRGKALAIALQRMGAS